MQRILVGFALTTAMLLPVVSAGAGTSSGGCDFNGDGFDDLAIGTPEGNGEQGEVNVIYGSSSRLTAQGNQLWTQDSPGMPGPGGAESFGFVTECGDFDNDTYDDLVIANPLEDLGTQIGSGSVIVLYGTADGLSTNRTSRFHRGMDGVDGDPSTGGAFGRSLAAGDFDGDGDDDLVVGVPGDSLGAYSGGVGSVHVFNGAPGGLTTAGDRIWSRDTPGIRGVPSAIWSDWFGRAVQAADFDGDGYDDLAVGVSRAADVDGVIWPGAVNVIYGSASGLTPAGDQLWHLDQKDMTGAVEPYAHYGSILAAGDFNNDSYADLAVGIPREDVASESDAGAVSIIYGTADGLRGAGSQMWHRNKPGVNRRIGHQHNFGHSVAVGDFNIDGYDDLLIGVPGDDRGVKTGHNLRVGSAHVLWGGPGGVVAARDQVYDQARTGIRETLDREDSFGDSVSTGDFNGNGAFDLAIAVPGESSTPPPDEEWFGAIAVIYGTVNGPRKTDQLWMQGVNGLLGTPEVTEGFGMLDNSVPD